MKQTSLALAVTALAVSGLWASAINPLPGTSGEPPGRPEAAARADAASGGWTDPPASPRAEAARPVQTSAIAPGIAPSLTLLPPPNAARAQLADEWAQRRLAQQSQRRRLVQRSARLRQAAAERGAAERARIADQAAVEQQTRGSEKGIDLIGDLIRGLGLGRGQQG